MDTDRAEELILRLRDAHAIANAARSDCGNGNGYLNARAFAADKHLACIKDDIVAAYLDEFVHVATGEALVASFVMDRRRAPDFSTSPPHGLHTRCA